MGLENKGHNAIVDKWRDEKNEVLRILKKAFADLKGNKSLRLPISKDESSSSMFLKRVNPNLMELKIINTGSHTCFSRAEVHFDSRGSVSRIKVSVTPGKDFDFEIDPSELFTTPIFAQHLKRILEPEEKVKSSSPNGATR